MGFHPLAAPAISAAFLHPSRNRPLLSEMDPNKLASEQPKLCYWNKLCPRGGSNLPIRAFACTHTRLPFARTRVLVYLNASAAAGCVADDAARNSLSVGIKSGRKCHKFGASHRKPPPRRSRNARATFPSATFPRR